MSDPRRIAYLCLQATTEGQASHAHVHEIISGLRESGWTVDLFQPAYAGGVAPGAFGRLAEFARVERRLVATLKTGGYDALYVRGHALAWPAARTAARMGVPVVQECNGPYGDFYAVWPQARVLRPFIDYLTRSQFASASACVAVTPELADWIKSETGRFAVVIGNGANTALFNPRAVNVHAAELPAKYAVFFGALSPWQGLDLLLAAAQHADWPHDVALVVIGSGALLTDVEAAARGCDQIISLGSLPYREVGGVVASATCSLVLSDRVGAGVGLSPLKMYESMACGVPLVVPDIAGSGTTVREHGCGVVIEASEPADVARAVAYLTANPAVAQEMGARGRAAVEAHYSWRARALQTKKVIESVL